MRDRESLASAVTERLYQEKPSLLEKHGEYGRTKCLQDMRYNIEHLLPAVELDDVSLFSRYVLWLDDLLRARNVDTDDVVRCLTILRDECTARYGDDGAFIARIIDGGMSDLQRGEA
ncbi:MAG TPA: hypothetical protein VF042_14175 [Gemmatimonadaceae bacterium]